MAFRLARAHRLLTYNQDFKKPVWKMGYFLDYDRLTLFHQTKCTFRLLYLAMTDSMFLGYRSPKGNF